jgi:hypothetical protein
VRLLLPAACLRLESISTTLAEAKAPAFSLSIFQLIVY